MDFDVNGLIQNLVALTGHLAWPSVTGVVLYAARDEIRSLIANLAQIEVSKGKITLKTLQATQGRLETVEERQAQINELVRPVLGGASAAAPTADVDAELSDLAADYEVIEASDRGTRVRMKDRTARKMASIVIERGISRDQLANSGQEGLVLALATVAHTLPEPADTARLLLASQGVRRWHVQYRISQAFAVLVEGGMASPDEVAEIKQTLAAFAAAGDDSLRRRVTQTRAIIAQAESDSP